MFTIALVVILIGSWIWIGWEIYRAPIIKEDDIDDDPTTTFWHEDDDKK